MNERFAADIITGLSASPKFLPSKYFYDDLGSQLFQEIMALEEYYLTDCEFEILSTYKDRLLQIFSEGDRPFDLVELGAGDGLKTKILLRHFLDRGASFDYRPIDISQQAMTHLTETLQQELPHLPVRGICDEYFHGLHALQADHSRRRVVLFLGSSIGNFRDAVALDFLQHLRANLNPGDLLLTGFDLMKCPQTILRAYDDSQGVTRAFNFNLLHRINRELDGNLDCDRFLHYPTYNPVTGDTESFLISTAAQTVTLRAIDRSFRFDAWEAIHVEVSRKYSLAGIADLADRAGFEPVKDFFDGRHYFTDALWAVPGDRAC